MFVIEISHLDDNQLLFYGWLISKETTNYLVYVHVRTGEEQMVSKVSPKYLLIDDVNDARQMSAGDIIVMPSDH